MIPDYFTQGCISHARLTFDLSIALLAKGPIVKTDMVRLTS